jgi:hypothetical protein
VISRDELAAIAAALAMLSASGSEPSGTNEMPVSRWKLAARTLDAESDDVRSLR